MKKIVLVDDEDSIRMIAQMSMERDGWEVASFDNAMDAFNAVKTTKPDAVLMDLMMPEMDGRELIAKLKEEGVSIPCIFLSARHDMDEELLGLGARGVLQKPFNPLTLGQQVRELISG